MKKIIITIMMLAIIPMVFAFNNNPTIASNGECFVEEPIPLYEGFNLIALYWNNGSYPLTGDRNISLVEGLNLVGNSGVREFKLKDITFTNATNTYSFADSGLNNIEVLRDRSDDDLAVGNEYITNPKYIYPQEGFWITSASAGNITLPNVGGALSGETYDVSKLRFLNGSGSEKSFADAVSEWLDGNPKTWNQTGSVMGNPTYGWITISSGDLEPWKGYFVNSLQDNLTLIRQNTTEPCKVKAPKYYNNNGNGKHKIKVYNNAGKTKGKFLIWLNHAMRLFGGTKDSETI